MNDSSRMAGRRARARRRRISILSAGIIATFMAFGLVGVVLAVHDEGFQLEGNATAADTSFVDIDDTNPGNPVNTVLTPGDLCPGTFCGPYDWDSLLNNGGPGGTVQKKAVLPAGFTDAGATVDFKATGTTFITSDDTTFATGSKDTLAITPGWQCNQDNNVNSKTDIVNAYASILEKGSQRFLYFGMEKDVDNGDNNVGIWLLQDPNVGCTSSGGNVAFTGNHVDGDLFIVSAFTNGGGVSGVTAYQWMSGAIDPNPVAVSADCLDTIGTGLTDRLCAVVNGKTITMPWKSVDGGVVNAPKVSPNFFEGGIELSAFPNFADTCFTSFLFSTRSSQSLTANLFDYAQGSIDTCRPDLSLQKTPDSGTHFVGDTFDWNIAVTNSGDGSADDAVVTDTIPAGLQINSATVQAPGSGSCQIALQVVTCTIDVPAAGSVNIQVNVTALGAAVTDPSGCSLLTNTASVTGDEDTSDNTDTGQITICRLAVTKDASTSYTRTYQWSIDKTASPNWSLFDGESGISDYDITITQTGFVDSATHVSGNIHVANPATIAATINSVTDVLATDGSATVTCGVVFPYSLAAGATLDCTYSKDTAAATNQLNTATAVLANTPSGTTNFTGTANVTFGAPTVIVDDTVSVSDTNEWTGDTQPFGPFNSSDTASYSETFDCSKFVANDYTSGHASASYDNTATLTGDDSAQTLDSATATVDLDCYKLAVSKNATPTYTRTYHWTIDKSSNDPNGHALVLNPGEVYVNYPYSITVGLAATPYTDSDFAVHGVITINNPNPDRVADLTAVTDVVSVGLAATVDCHGATTVPKGGSIDCDYSRSLPDKTSRTNTATATQQLYDFDSGGNATADGTKDYSGTANVTFGSPTTLVDETVHVVDDYGTPGDTSDDIDFGNLTVGVDTLPHEFTYYRTFGPFTTDQCGDHTIKNTATFETNDTHATGSDDWTVVITVPCNTGCTLTQGYWKTHSSKGPAKPPDPTWVGVGADFDGDGNFEGPNETFYISGQTWYEVFWTAPKKGNVYYILAHQYEAAVLNILSGADSTAQVNATIAAADAWFKTHTPSSNVSKAERNTLISWAGILGSYNEGTTGPGHCSEDSIARAAPA